METSLASEVETRDAWMSLCKSLDSLRPRENKFRTHARYTLIAFGVQMIIFAGAPPHLLMRLMA